MGGQLEGQVALVTGASRGIGRSIAEVFAREGAQVVICGRKQEALEGVAQEIGPRVKAIACHVGRGEQIQALVDQVMREHGRIDLLVNNAGTNIVVGSPLEMEDAQFDKMVEIN